MIKPKMLIIGDAVAKTGFARVIYEVFHRLIDDYEIYQLGTNYFGDPHDWPWKIFPAGIGQYSLGENRVKGLVHNLKPDIIFMLQDPWALSAYFKELEFCPDIPKVVYASLNAETIENSLPNKLKEASRLAVYTQFAKGAMEKAIKHCGLHSFPSIEVIPHGVCANTFFPLSTDRSKARAIARTSVLNNPNEAIQNGFIVLNSNRNQPRKRIDVAMEGFAMFAQGKPENVFMHLHMGLKDIGWDLKYLEKRFGLDNRLIFTTASESPPDVTDAMLNMIFNAANVGMNTASSEGWGLISFEQAAAGLPQIVPNHTSGAELWGDSAFLLPISQTLVNPHSNISEHLIRSEDVAEVLQRAYENDNELEERGKLCYKNALNPGYNWPKISQIWKEIFEEELLRSRK